MASFKKLKPLKDGTKRIKITVEEGYSEDTGKRIRHTKTVRMKSMSQRSIKKAITEFEIEVATKVNQMSFDKITFTQFIDKWFENYVDPDLAVKTSENYRYWTRSMRDFLGEFRLSKIKPLHIVEYFNNEKKEGRGCLRQKYICFKSIFSKAIKWELIENNPMDGVDKPAAAEKRREGKIMYYNDDQLSLLIKLLADEKPRFRMIVKLACLVGLRRSEISGIQLKNIDFNNNTILINKTLTWDQRNKKYLLAPTKTKVARTVHVPDKLMVELKGFVKERRIFTMELGNSRKVFEFEGEDIELLFVTNKGGPLRPEFLTASWTMFLKKHEDLPHLNLHGLRHTYASTSINNGVDYRVVQEQLGHASFGETMDTYSHLDERKKKEATEVFNNII